MPDEAPLTFEPGESGPDGHLVCSCRHLATAHDDPSRTPEDGCEVEGCPCQGYDAGALLCANPACNHPASEHIWGEDPRLPQCTVAGCPCSAFVYPPPVGGAPPADTAPGEAAPVRRGRGDLPPSIVQLVFEAAGAATSPLLQDHPDYEFPSERVQAAIEKVLAEWVPDEGEFGRDIKQRPTVEINPSQITRVQTRSGTWHQSGFDPDFMHKGPDPTIETMGIWIDTEGPTREAIGVGPVLVLGGPSEDSRVAISFDDIAAIQYRKES